MRTKLTPSIARATIFISVIGLVSKGLGFLREMLFASFFGLGSEIDVYLIGAVLPLTINTIIFYLTQNYIIPAYNKIKEKDYRLTENFINVNFLIIIFVGISISVILYSFSDIIINIYLQNAKIEIVNTATIIFRLFLISIPINCAISVLSAYQHLNFEFRYPAFAHLLLNISFIILIIIFGNSIDIYVIPLGYITGSLLQMLYLIYKSKLKFRLIQSALLLKKYKKFIPDSLLMIILIESIGQLYLLTDRYFYNYVPTGGIAALNYAQTIFFLPISILSIALSTTIFPRFSQLISKNLLDKLENSFKDSIKINVAIFIPITFLFIYYGDFFIRIFYERGKFTVTDTWITYQVLKFFSASLVFYSVYTVMNKMIYSLGLIKNLFYITIIGIFIKIIMNYLLVMKFKQNGLALSSSISYLFFFFSSLFLIYKNKSFKNINVFFTELTFQLSNGIISLFLVKQLSALLANKIFILDIILFLLTFIFNIILVKHSSFQMFNRIIGSLKSNRGL